MSSVGFIRPLYSRHRCIDGSMERKFLAEGDTTDLRSRLFDPRSRAIVSFPLRFHGTSLSSSSFSVSRAHVYTNPEEKLPEIRFYSGIGSENARGKQFPVKR